MSIDTIIISIEKITQDYSRIAPMCQSPALTWIITKSLSGEENFITAEDHHKYTITSRR